MKAGTYIVGIVALGFVLIGYLFWAAPESAPAQMPLVLASIAAAVAVLQKQGEVETKVEKSTAISKENAQSIAAVSQQTNSALEDVSQKVNGHLTSLLDEIRALTHKVSSLEKDKAVKQERAEQADSATSQILTAIAAIPAVVAPLELPPHEGQVGPGEHQ